MNAAANDGKASQKESPFERSSISNLVRFKSSKTYFAHFKVNGRLVRQSLKTTVMSIARNRLAELIKQERERHAAATPGTDGKLTFDKAVETYLERLDGNPDIKPATRKYRRQCVAAIRKTWPGIDDRELRKITKAEVTEWAHHLRLHGTKFKPPGAKNERKGISSSRFNNTVTTLRQILEQALDMGILLVNPVHKIKRAREVPKELKLPSRAHFPEFVRLIETSGAAKAKAAGELVKFLAFSGARIGEAIRVTWADISFEKDELIIRGDPETGTKNWEIRRVPMIAELKTLLGAMRQLRSGESLEKTVLRVRECQKSMDRACKVLSIPRLTHHDLRHLFATTAIEAGVDIPSVAKLLGHKDGGVLALKTYGHIRETHSKEMAQKITFGFSTPATAA